MTDRNDSDQLLGEIRKACDDAIEKLPDAAPEIADAYAVAGRDGVERALRIAWEGVVDDIARRLAAIHPDLAQRFLRGRMGGAQPH